MGNKLNTPNFPVAKPVLADGGTAFLSVDPVEQQITEDTHANTEAVAGKVPPVCGAVGKNFPLQDFDTCTDKGSKKGNFEEC